VTVQQLETNSHYRIIVVFNELLGDVPTLSGNTYFKCVGGAEVIDDISNVEVTYTGDGPLLDLTFSFSFDDADTVDVVITEALTNSLRGRVVTEG
jgi:hypothetical protein